MSLSVESFSSNDPHQMNLASIGLSPSLSLLGLGKAGGQDGGQGQEGQGRRHLRGEGQGGKGQEACQGIQGRGSPFAR
jgi:hypothetical protein